MSLRNFHLLFIFVVIVGADLFGVWAVSQYVRAGDRLMLAIGIVTILGGLGLILYAVRFIRKMNAEGVR